MAKGIYIFQIFFLFWRVVLQLGMISVGYKLETISKHQRKLFLKVGP